MKALSDGWSLHLIHHISEASLTRLDVARVRGCLKEVPVQR